MEQNQADVKLIQEVLNGNPDQYSLLVKRHQRFVFTLAMRFSKNREDAEEIAQDCFIKAYKALGTFKQGSKFSTWLYTITYTTAMTFLRKKRLFTTSIDDDSAAIQLEHYASHYTAGNYEQKDRRRFLNEAINLLSVDDATIITLFYQGEQSLEEIGKALNMEANTVKVKLHRARLRLKEKLQYLLKDEVKELI